MPRLQVGSINEKGFIHNLTRKGFSNEKCITELISNSIDAKQLNKILHFIVEIDYEHRITLHDDGKGMNEHNIKDMFEMNKSNHQHDESMGVSGIGGKAALLCLSRSGNCFSKVTIQTHSENHGFYKIEIPWKEIFDQGIYTDKICVKYMTPDEKIQFICRRENIGLGEIGTSIFFEPIPELEALFLRMFSTFPFDEELAFENRIEVIFGNIKDVCFKIHTPSVSKCLKPYNFFDPNNSFLIPPVKKKIYLYEDNQKIIRSVCDNKEFQPYGKQGAYRKKLNNTPPTIPLKWKYKGIVQLEMGIHKDIRVFDTEHPKKDSGAEFILPTYDEDFVHPRSLQKEKITLIHLIRNNQVICPSIWLKENKTTNARANFSERIRYHYIRMRVFYKTKSEQTNFLDEFFEIQENKNQHKETFSNTGFRRLLVQLRDDYHQKVMDYIIQCRQVVNQSVIQNESEITMTSLEEIEDPQNYYSAKEEEMNETSSLFCPTCQRPM